MEFFFYGTLMDDDVLSRVTGRRLPSNLIESATLSGYRRVYVAKAFYPVLVADSDGVVEGHLVSGMTPREVECIFAFEDEDYVAQVMTVAGDRSGDVPAVGGSAGAGR